MKGICPNCEKETEVELIKTKETINVRQDEILVDVEYFRCRECKEDFENTQGVDSLELAYREYRYKHSMFQPEEIKSWRKSYGLTQKELCSLLGWGEITLSRYENGALQNEAHEKIFRLARDPHNLLKLISEAPSHVFSEEKRKRLLDKLVATGAESCSFESIFEERYSHSSPDEFSGYSKFNLTKFFNAVLFFSKEGDMLKTKLNKLLFYADFKHFKESTVSISGSAYPHLPYGPVPDDFDFLYGIMRRKGMLTFEERPVGEYYGEYYRSIKNPDLSVFSDSELRVLLEVKNFFEGFGAKKITDFSHDERGYKETDSGEYISYTYAQFLQI